MNGRARVIARQAAERAELAERRPAHPGIPVWRWLARDGALAHAFDEAAGIPFRSACDQARWSVALRLGGVGRCSICRDVMGGAAE